MTVPGDGGGVPSSSTGPRRRRPEPTPVQRALGLLTRREHSRKELQRKLEMRGVATADAQATVARMDADGWQSDARYAESLVRSRASSGYGPAYIRAELGMHGLPADLITAAMKSFEGDWMGIAHDLAQRRFPQSLHGDLAARRKAADYLLRRGFSMDCVRAACAPDG